ncbi:MAG: hypothetical protein FJ090_14410 [Deltaproteobacteria bacterium]|nr:hypothetical protein [Deltaproteobacteria bacterium]
MIWDLPPRLRCDIACFTGINLSGERRHVDVQAVNGRQGPDVEPEELRSVVFIADVGTTLVMKTHAGDDWEKFPWRAVRIMKGKAFTTKQGGLAVRVPDLDFLDKPSAPRTDPDVQEWFPYAETLAAGEGWTFGRPGELKGKIVAISVLKPA